MPVLYIEEARCLKVNIAAGAPGVTPGGNSTKCIQLHVWQGACNLTRLLRSSSFS